MLYVRLHPKVFLPLPRGSSARIHKGKIKSIMVSASTKQNNYGLFSKIPTPASPALTQLHSDPVDVAASPSAFCCRCLSTAGSFCTYSQGPQGDEEPRSCTEETAWQLHRKAAARIWVPIPQHRTFITADGFSQEATVKNTNTFHGAAATPLWKRCNAKELSANNAKRGIIYIHRVKAWKQPSTASSVQLIFSLTAGSGRDCKHKEGVAGQKVKYCFDSPTLLLVCKDWLSEL